MRRFSDKEFFSTIQEGKMTLPKKTKEPKRMKENSSMKDFITYCRENQLQIDVQYTNGEGVLRIMTLNIRGGNSNVYNRFMCIFNKT